jgi:general secretion pathway protein D
VSTNDFSISLPGALIQALLSDSSARVLNRPQLRVTDGGKGSLKIGSKIPYVSGSLNSAVATPGAIPYATTQFQQIDTGVNIDLEPRVNGADDVTMHLKVDISQVSGYTDIAVIQQPTISQHVNEANVRMRDGELAILGGLTQNSTADTNAGLPGILDIPVLGYFLGSKQKNHTEDEILIAVTPHIIRKPDLSVMSEEPIDTGSENNVKVFYSEPQGGAAGAATTAPQPAAPQPQGTPAPQQLVPQSQTQPAPQQPVPQSQAAPQQPGRPTPNVVPPAPQQASPGTRVFNPPVRTVPPQQTPSKAPQR